MKYYHLLLFQLVLALLIFSCSPKGTINPVNLTCEYMTNPAVVDATSPRLSWINEASSKELRGVSQSAYRIIVASSQKKLLKNEADLWDTGKQSSTDSHLIAYAGKPLRSAQDCWWKVMVWDENDIPSAWSKAAHWGMGLLDPNEWKAKWIGAPWQGEESYKKVTLEQNRLPANITMEQIQQFLRSMAQRPQQQQQQGQQSQQQNRSQIRRSSNIITQVPAPLLRKSFDIKGKVASAKAFVVGLGYFEFYLNGQKLGDEVLIPNQTNYSFRPIAGQYGESTDDLFRTYRIMYLAYDITDILKEGKNVAGAILGEGFYNATGQYQIPYGSSRFLGQIEIFYEDGTKELVCSDESWKAHPSPILTNGVFEGEVYDANKEIMDWSTVQISDDDWETVAIRESPTGQLSAHTAPGDVIYESLKPVSLTKLEDGSYEADFGVEITGWIRFENFIGNKGDTMVVEYANDQQTVYNRYIFNGENVKEYAPRFTWFTFSKAVINGIDNLTPEMLTAEMVCTNLPITSEFDSSNELFTQINTIWRRSQLDNSHGGIASDCPHRERSGYTGDGQLSCPTTMNNFDAAAFYKKWIRDMNDAQNVKTGHVPNVVPTNNGAGGIGWGAAINIMPWEFYLHYGDKNILEENYFAMTEYVRYMSSLLGPDGVIDATKDPDASKNVGLLGNLGDWCPPYENPENALVHQFYFWMCADICSKAADILGNETDANKYATIASDLKEAFHKRFYDVKNKTYGDYGSNVFALTMGVPQECYDDVVETLRKEIVETYSGHLNTGISGTRYFFETLANNGLNNVAYDAMNKRDFPSFGNWIEQGATVTWEHWNGRGSHNHPMFGGGLNWFYNTLAGVNYDEKEPGFKHIIIKPILADREYYVYYSNITPYGKVASRVDNKTEQLSMEITVPVGSYATVYIPDFGSNYITESGIDIKNASNLKIERIEDGYSIVNVPQGSYSFNVK